MNTIIDWIRTTKILLVGALVAFIGLGIFSTTHAAEPVYFEIQDGTWQYSFNQTQWMEISNLWWDTDSNSLIWTDPQDNKYSMGPLGTVIDMNELNQDEQLDIARGESMTPIFSHPRYRDQDYDATNTYLDDGQYGQYAMPRQHNTWQGQRGYYYQIGSDGNLWISVDGQNWKDSFDDSWKGYTGSWYKLASDGELLVSQDNGRNWVPSPDNTWRSIDGDVYMIDVNGDVMREREVQSGSWQYEPRLRSTQELGRNTTWPTYPDQVNTNHRDVPNYPDYYEEDVVDNPSYTMNNEWSVLANNMWKNEEQDVYYQITNGHELRYSFDGTNWRMSTTGIWQGQQGTFYQLGDNMSLYESQDGSNWEMDEDQKWMNNDLYYKVDMTGTVHYSRG